MTSLEQWQSTFTDPKGTICVLNHRLPQKVMKIGYMANDRIYSTWELAYANRSTYIESPHQCITLQDYLDGDIADLGKSYQLI